MYLYAWCWVLEKSQISFSFLFLIFILILSLFFLTSTRVFRSIKCNVHFCVFYIFLPCSMFFLLFSALFWDLLRIFIFNFSVSLKYILFFYCVLPQNYHCFLLSSSMKRLEHTLMPFTSFTTDMILLLDMWSLYFSIHECNHLCNQYSYRLTYRLISFYCKPLSFKLSIILYFDRQSYINFILLIHLQ